MPTWLAVLLAFGVLATAFEVKALVKQLEKIDGLLREIKTHLERIEDPPFTSKLGGACGDLRAIRRQVVKPGPLEELAVDDESEPSGY